MSTLQVVGTVVGAVIGAIVTWPAGGSGAFIGAAIGGAIGAGLNAIVNPPRIEGARLGDLTVVSSATGTVRPVGYGRIRVAGNVIWAIPIIEHKKESKGGGKGGPVSTTYDYGATFALALCEGTVDSVLRIWADSKLVFDATPGQDSHNKLGFNFRFYPGNETQTADSIIEAHEGAGNVPGYRGTCYLVFDDIPLADYGNRIPSITAEVVFSSEPVFDYQLLTRADPSIFASLESESVAVNPLSHIGYVFGDTPTGIVEFDVDTMVTIREATMATVLAPLASGDDGGSNPGVTVNKLVGWDGALYFVTGANANGPHIVRVNADTLLATAEFSAPAAGIVNTPTEFPFVRFMCFITYVDPDSGLVNLLLAAGFFATIGALSVPGLGYVWGEDADPEGGRTSALCQGKIAVAVGEAWLFTYDGGLNEVYLSKISYEGGTPGLSLEQTFVATDFHGSATAFYFLGGFPGSMIYDEGDDGILFQVQVLVGGVLTHVYAKWSSTSGIIFATTSADANVLPNPLGSRVSGGNYAVLSGLVAGVNSYVHQIDTATGDVISSDLWPIGLGNALARQVYESVDELILVYATGPDFSPAGQWAKLRIGRMTSTGATLGSIVLDQCERAGFDAADIDVTALTDVVEGFVISQRSLVIDVLKPLLQVYLVDAVESDYVLHFTHRGGATVADLTEADLVRTGTEVEPFVETRQQEIELPMRLTLTYIDFDKDFQQNTQAAKRSRHPNPTVFTDNQTDLQLAVVSTATPAKQMAERIMFSVWNERKSYAARLPPKYGKLDAGDPITLTLNDGLAVRGRLAKADVGVDHSIDVTIVVETTQQNLSIAVADDGIPWAGSEVIANPTGSKLILIDSPLLRDVDDLHGAAMRGYWAGGSFNRSGTWPGGVLQESPDIAIWTTIDVATAEMTWGVILTPPADPGSFWHTQLDGSMTILVRGGTSVPTTTTDLGLANLANPMAIIKANGEVEVIQYRDVTALGSGQYTLSVFYRGVRGTDAMGGGIAAGDTFVFLSTTGVNEIAVPLADHNVNDFYRLVTSGGLAAGSLLQGFTYHGRDLMPYAPDNAAAGLSGSDIILTWVRRTRFNGELKDSIDTVPLNEATEAYEIDVLSGPSGSVLRTLTAATSTVTYTAAQIAADFGSAPANLSVDIYQMSDAVGRGFATEQTLEVA